MSITLTQPLFQSSTFGWISIVRLGLVQAAIGAIVVMTTSTLNRIMVVELALPASLPGLLVAIHYFVQVIRPRMGFESDVGGKRTPWIIGGIGLLALGGFGAAIATTLMGFHLMFGIAAAIVAFFLIGIGVSMSGTSLLALLAKGVSDGLAHDDFWICADQWYCRKIFGPIFAREGHSDLWNYFICCLRDCCVGFI
jgi:BCD family chlorophyll transporter-like MFS transporter